MINLILFLLTFGTLLYVSLKDKSMRASKYVFLIILCLISLHHWYLKLNHNYLNLVIFLYILDELISFIPKLNALNMVRKINSIDYKFVSYQTLSMIELNVEFNFSETAKGTKISQFDNFCQFHFDTAIAGKTEFYSKDFYSNIKILQGSFDLIICDHYGNLTKKLCQTGETFLINPYIVHAFDYHDVPSKVIFKAIKFDAN